MCLFIPCFVALFLLLWAVKLLLRLVQLSFVEAIMARSVIFRLLWHGRFFRHGARFFLLLGCYLVAIRVRLYYFWGTLKKNSIL